MPATVEDPGADLDWIGGLCGERKGKKENPNPDTSFHAWSLVKL
jgi:hypothetical protein